MALYFFNIDIIEILKYIICYLTNFILSSLVFLSVTWTLRPDTPLWLRTSWPDPCAQLTTLEVHTMQLFLVIASFAIAQAFISRGFVRVSRPLFDSVEVKQEVPEEFDESPREESPKTGGDMFNMNRRVRLGRSRDQDGKSNIWSIGE